MTHSIDQTLHQFANLLLNWTLLPILTLLPNFGGFHRTLQRVRLANRGRLLLRTPGPVPLWNCICSNVETILSWTCHVYGPFEFRTSLGTSILLIGGSYFLPLTPYYKNSFISIWWSKWPYLTRVILKLMRVVAYLLWTMTRSILKLYMLMAQSYSHFRYKNERHRVTSFRLTSYPRLRSQWHSLISFNRSRFQECLLKTLPKGFER